MSKEYWDCWKCGTNPQKSKIISKKFKDYSFVVWHKPCRTILAAEHWKTSEQWFRYCDKYGI